MMLMFAWRRNPGLKPGVDGFDTLDGVREAVLPEVVQNLPLEVGGRHLNGVPGALLLAAFGYRLLARNVWVQPLSASGGPAIAAEKSLNL